MSDTPIAINTPDVVEILKDLYPDKHILHDRYNDITPKNFITSYKPLTLEGFIKLFAGIPHGKAAGPLGDITDIIKSMAIHVEHPNNKHIYANTIFHLFIMINTDQIPNSIKKHYNTIFLFGLHKDALNKKNKTSSCREQLEKSIHIHIHETQQTAIHGILSAIKLCYWSKGWCKFCV